MREVKFRAKISASDFEQKLALLNKPQGEGEWAYGEIHVQSSISHIHVKSFRYPINVDTIGQYTGLKDKNGKEIYEGDIVDWTFFYNSVGLQGAVEKDITLRGVITWGTAGFVFEVWSNDFENAGWYGISSLNFDPTSDIEIVGNIYNNPELVEQ